MGPRCNSGPGLARAETILESGEVRVLPDTGDDLFGAGTKAVAEPDGEPMTICPVEVTAVATHPSMVRNGSFKEWRRCIDNGFKAIADCDYVALLQLRSRPQVRVIGKSWIPRS